MSPQKMQTVKRLFDAVERRDQVGVLETYHPKIVIHEAPSLPYGGDYYGYEGARRHGIGYARTWDAFQRTPAERSLNPIFLETTEDYMVVLFRQKAVVPGSGRMLDLPEVGVYKIRDGKVIESWMFHQDTVALLEFLKEAQQQTP
jgi:ketosteroid isomerase-like protein